MLNLHHLRLLVELQKKRTMAAVADAIGYPTSTVSQQLAQLEKSTGVVLLRKVGRNVALTQAAVELCEQAEVMLAQHDRAEALLAMWKAGVRQQVVVALPHEFLTSGLAKLMFGNAATHRELRVVVVEDPPHWEHGLENGDLDLVVSAEYPGQQRPLIPWLRRRELIHDELLLLSSPGWMVEALPVKESYPWTMAQEGTAARTWAVATVQNLGYEPQTQYVTNALDVQARIAADGLGLAIVPSLAVPLGLDVHRAVLPGRPHVVYTAVSVAAASNRPAVDLVAGLIRRHLAGCSREARTALPPHLVHAPDEHGT